MTHIGLWLELPSVLFRSSPTGDGGGCRLSTRMLECFRVACMILLTQGNSVWVLSTFSWDQVMGIHSTPALLAHWMPSAASAPSCLAPESFESEVNDCPQGQLFIASCSSPVALELLIWDPAVAGAALWRCPHRSRMWQTGVHVDSKGPWSWLWLLPVPWAGMASWIFFLPFFLTYQTSTPLLLYKCCVNWLNPSQTSSAIHSLWGHQYADTLIFGISQICPGLATLESETSALGLQCISPPTSHTPCPRLSPLSHGTSPGP